jgi:hypothetical protein
MPESPARRPPRFQIDTRTALHKVCSACKKTIYFIKNPKTRQLVPVNADGTSHFATCSDPKRFSRKKPGKKEL